MKLSFDVDGRSSISRPILVEGRGMGFEGMTPLKHEKSQLAGTNWDHTYASCLFCFPPNAHFGDAVLEFPRSFANDKRDVLWIANKFKLWREIFRQSFQCGIVLSGPVSYTHLTLPTIYSV